jgi:hypothetical protein
MNNEKKDINLWETIKDESFWTNIIALLLCLLFLYSYILQPLISNLWGVNEIGHRFESPKPYIAKYYVNLFPENSEIKNYKVKADLYVYKRCEEYEEDTKCWRMVNLQKVYFPNKEVFFDDCLLDSSRISCYDKNNNYWDIEFNNEKIKE